MSRGGWYHAFQFFGGQGIGGWGTQNLFKPNSAVNIPPAALGIDFQGAQYGPPITVLYGQNKVAGNVIWYGDFASQAESAPGGKGGGGSAIGYTYSASFLLALCEGATSSLVTAYDGTTAYTPGNGPLSGNFFKTGTSGQAAWSHLTGAAALGYDHTCLYGFANYNLQNTPSLPNLNFEVAGLKQFGSGIVDANPSDILTDICTDANHGVNFGFLGTLTQYSNYCVANGIFLSPVFDTQSTGQQALSDLFKYTNTEAFFSENQLKVVPRGDTTVTGNGVTFNPVKTIRYQFDATNILTSNKGDPLVQIDRKAPADCRNIIRLSFNDRGFQYSPSSVVASIDYDVLTNGARAEQDESYAGVTTASVGKIVAQNLLQQDFYVRNNYTWKAPWRFCDLEPMDLVEVTDPDQGLNNEPVRITSVEEDEYGVLTIVGEEYPEGIGFAVQFPVEPNVGTNIDAMSDPGPVQAPYIVRGPGLLVSNNQPEIWIAVTGTNPLWGGCTGYISYDGVTYQQVSQIARQALYGIVALPVWVASNVQTVGQLIQDPSGNTQRVAAITGDFKTGSSAPAFSSTVGTPTTDNHVTWVCVAVKIPAAAAPTLATVTAGALAATTYYAFVTWLDQYGRETTAGTEANIAIALNHVPSVTQPTVPAGAVSWRIYMSNTTGGGSGHETQQVTLPVATTSWQLPNTGLIAGSTVPTINTTGLFSLPAAADPDQVNIPRVYLYRGQMLGGSQSDADNFATLSMLDTELLSYEGATLASDGGYDLSYIRRGGYNSTDTAHISGAPFIRFDSNIIRVPVDPSLIGKQVWFKFLSINVFNKTPRTLAGETAYTYTVGTNQETPDVPTSVSALSASASADIVNLSWTNPSDLAIGGTSIEYAPTWSPYNQYAVGFTMIDPLGNTQQISAITTGISGPFPVPTFANTVGSTITDGGVTWKCIAIGPITATNLGTPATPFVSFVPGSMVAGTWHVSVTYLDQYGLESLPSSVVTVTFGSSSNITIALVNPPANAAAWNVYVGTSPILSTTYKNLPIGTPTVTMTTGATGSQTPPAIDNTSQGGFTVLHNTAGQQNHYKHQQAGDQEYYYRIRQRGWLAQAGWGPYSAIVSAAHANTVRKNSARGSANLLLDPNFDRSRSLTDQTFWLYNAASYEINMTGGVDSTPCGQTLNFPGTAGQVMEAAEYCPCKVGDSFYARAMFRRTSTNNTGNMILGANFYDQTFTNVGNDEIGIPLTSIPNNSNPFEQLGGFLQVPAGAHYGRMYFRLGTSANTNVRFDKCFFSIQDYAVGSTPQAVANTTLSYTSTTTSITVSWSSFNILLPDGSTLSVGTGSQAVTGLASNTHFNTYPTYRGDQGFVDFMLSAGFGQGTPRVMFTATNIVACQAQQELQNYPMSTGSMQVATPSSGTGSGSGGGSSGGTGGCLHGRDTVRARIHGHVSTVHADMLEDGDELWTPQGWLPISDVKHMNDYAYLAIVTSEGQSLIRTGQHLLYDHKGREIRVDALRPGMMLEAENGRVRIVEMRLEDEESTRVSFTVAGHIYFATPGGVREHNTNAKP